MSPLADLMAYDRQAVVFGGADSPAEASDLTTPQTAGEAVRVNAIWDVDQDADRYGFVADWADVLFPQSEVAFLGAALRVRRADRALVVRYPADLEAREEWQIYGVDPKGGCYRVEAFRTGRLKPQP